MHFQVKLLSWPESGNHIVTIARGLVEIAGCDEIVQKIGELAIPLPECKVLVDLADARCKFHPAEIEAFVGRLKPRTWPRTSKIALVAASEAEQYAQLRILSGCLSRRGFNSAAFDNTKVAVNWLADTGM
jgi:hypothetical protein